MTMLSYSYAAIARRSTNQKAPSGQEPLKLYDFSIDYIEDSSY